MLQNAEFGLPGAGRREEAGRAPRLSDVEDDPVEWEGVREQIGRPDVRWKDLRGCTATYYLLAGGEPRELQMILRHSTVTMTTRYLKRLPAGNRKILREHSKSFGLPYESGHLRAVEGGSR